MEALHNHQIVSGRGGSFWRVRKNGNTRLLLLCCGRELLHICPRAHLPAAMVLFYYVFGCKLLQRGSTALEMSACEKSYQRYSSSWLLWKLHFSFYSAFSMGLIHTLAFLSFHPTHAPLCLQHNPSGHHHPPLKPHTHTQQVTTCQLWLFMKIYFYDCSDGELLAFCLWFWILFVWTTCRISVIVSNKNPSIRKVADLAYLNKSVVKALM